MKHDMLCVCLTRTSKQKYVKFCAIECHKPYIGYIYRYSYNDVSYIGCTTGIKQIQKAHNEQTTNIFGRALHKYEFEDFQFETLVNGRKLYDIEETYMIKYASTNNGYKTRIYY